MNLTTALDYIHSNKLAVHVNHTFTGLHSVCLTHIRDGITLQAQVERSLLDHAIIAAVQRFEQAASLGVDTRPAIEPPAWQPAQETIE